MLGRTLIAALEHDPVGDVGRVKERDDVGEAGLGEAKAERVEVGVVVRVGQRAHGRVAAVAAPVHADPLVADREPLRGPARDREEIEDLLAAQIAIVERLELLAEARRAADRRRDDRDPGRAEDLVVVGPDVLAAVEGADHRDRRARERLTRREQERVQLQAIEGRDLDSLGLAANQRLLELGRERDQAIGLHVEAAVGGAGEARLREFEHLGRALLRPDRSIPVAIEDRDMASRAGRAEQLAGLGIDQLERAAGRGPVREQDPAIGRGRAEQFFVEVGQLASLAGLARPGIDVAELLVVGGVEQPLAVPALERVGEGPRALGIGDRRELGHLGAQIDLDDLHAVAIVVDLGVEVEVPTVAREVRLAPREAQLGAVADDLAIGLVALGIAGVEQPQAGSIGRLLAAAGQVGDRLRVLGEAEAVDIVGEGQLLGHPLVERLAEVDPPQVHLLVVARVGVQPGGAVRAALGPRRTGHRALWRADGGPDAGGARDVRHSTRSHDRVAQYVGDTVPDPLPARGRGARGGRAPAVRGRAHT